MRVLIRLVLGVEALIRWFAVMLQTAIILVFVAGAARVTGLLPADMLPYFWLAAVVGLFTIAAPAYSAGYSGRVDDEYSAAIETAESRRNAARGRM